MIIDFAKLKIKGTSVKTVTLRELSGPDNDAAVERVVNSQTSSTTNGFLLGKAIAEQQLSDAIIEVDGVATVTPYLGWKSWNLRTQEYIRGAFNKMNAVDLKEMESFFQELGLVEKPGSSDAGK